MRYRERFVRNRKLCHSSLSLRRSLPLCCVWVWVWFQAIAAALVTPYPPFLVQSEGAISQIVGHAEMPCCNVWTDRFVDLNLPACPQCADGIDPDLNRMRIGNGVTAIRISLGHPTHAEYIPLRRFDPGNPGVLLQVTSLVPPHPLPDRLNIYQCCKPHTTPQTH